MEGRALRIVVGLLAMAVLLFWVVKPRRAKVAVVEAGILPPGADARVEGVTLLQSSAKGGLSLTARDAEWSHETERVRLSEVAIRFMGVSTAGGPAIQGHIQAERGDASTSGHQYQLAGRVEAETFDGYRLQTSDVSYDHQTRLADTSSPVTLTGPGLSVKGQGAQVDYQGQTVTIRGRVSARMIWSVLSQSLPDGVESSK